jgi:hypothetical protein
MGIDNLYQSFTLKKESDRPKLDLEALRRHTEDQPVVAQGPLARHSHPTQCLFRRNLWALFQA